MRMQARTDRPTLQLVDASVAPALRLASVGPIGPDAGAVARIRQENLAAGSLSADDARWILAAQAAATLEGGRLAMLRPERRRALVSVATKIGLRPFDASLVIAIVQDAARCGERPLGDGASQRLRLVRAATPGNGSARSILVALAAAAAIAAAGLLALIRWIGG
jgi:hypothetical protein